MSSYNTIVRIVCILKQALFNAMILCQSWTFNGHKRKYRFFLTVLTWWESKFVCKMYDYYQIMPSLEHTTYPPYQPKDMREHSTQWYALIKDACKQIAEANVSLTNDMGKQSKWVSLILCLLNYEAEKSYRWIERGNKVKWMEHDLFVHDDHIHKKFKCLEKMIKRAMVWDKEKV